jgi:hypothetical protein
MISLYFMTTTMTTVGYGDYSAGCWWEYVFIIFIQLIGTVVFAFISGSITSVLQSTDANSASTEERLLFLNKMKHQYNLSGPLY